MRKCYTNFRIVQERCLYKIYLESVYTNFNSVLEMFIQNVSGYIVTCDEITV